MRKLAFLTFIGAVTWLPAWSRTLPPTIHIHGPRPTTANLRQEFLQENAQYSLKLNSATQLRRVHFDTVYDPMLKLTTYYDTHLLDEMNRIDNPYGHNRPGIGLNF